MNYTIGVDFDNTLIFYDALFHKLAVCRGLVHQNVRKSKRHIRDRIRQLENGEDEWQKLQALVYGAKIQEAILIRGVQEFFKRCHYHNINVYIVSHKTEFANRKDIRTNLREAALSWMREKKFFDVDGLHLPLEKVYFEATRREKIERVKQLGCTHFIDDLEEIFHEHSFPKDVIRILYDPYQEKTFLPGMQIFPTWDGIIGYLGL